MPAVQVRPARHTQSTAPVETHQLQSKVEQLHAQAKDAAERGDISASAQLILMALDAERRLASRGPQVLQLIKPRD